MDQLKKVVLGRTVSKNNKNSIQELRVQKLSSLKRYTYFDLSSKFLSHKIKKSDRIEQKIKDQKIKLFARIR